MDNILDSIFLFFCSFFLGQAGGREGEGAEETRCLLQRAAGSAGREGKTFLFSLLMNIFPHFFPFLFISAPGYIYKMTFFRK